MRALLALLLATAAQAGTAATTTTTLPDAGCGGSPAAAFVSIDCRLDALAARVQGATGFQKPQTKTQLLGALTKVTGNKVAAETLCAKPDAKSAGKRLKKAIRGMIQFGHRLRSLTGRRTIEAGVRTELIAAGTSIQTDLKTLKTGLQCPADAP